MVYDRQQLFTSSRWQMFPQLAHKCLVTSCGAKHFGQCPCMKQRLWDNTIDRQVQQTKHTAMLFIYACDLTSTHRLNLVYTSLSVCPILFQTWSMPVATYLLVVRCEHHWKNSWPDMHMNLCTVVGKGRHMCFYIRFVVIHVSWRKPPAATEETTGAGIH